MPPVSASAFDVAVELAPVGVDVRRLPDGRDAAAFVVPDWDDQETLDACRSSSRCGARFGAEQLARFARGEPLRNVVRKAA